MDIIKDFAALVASNPLAAYASLISGLCAIAIFKYLGEMKRHSSAEIVQMQKYSDELGRIREKHAQHIAEMTVILNEVATLIEKRHDEQRRNGL